MKEIRASNAKFVFRNLFNMRKTHSEEKINVRWFDPESNALWMFVQREKYFEEFWNTRDIHNL